MCFYIMGRIKKLMIQSVIVVAGDIYLFSLLETELQAKGII